MLIWFNQLHFKFLDDKIALFFLKTFKFHKNIIDRIIVFFLPGLIESIYEGVSACAPLLYGGGIYLQRHSDVKVSSIKVRADILKLVGRELIYLNLGDPLL